MDDERYSEEDEKFDIKEVELSSLEELIEFAEKMEKKVKAHFAFWTNGEPEGRGGLLLDKDKDGNWVLIVCDYWIE